MSEMPLSVKADFKVIEHAPNVHILRFNAGPIAGDIDIQELGEKLYDFADNTAGKQGHVILDFKAVNYVGSVFLGKLINFKKKLSAKRTELITADVQPDVLAALRISKMDTFLNVNTEGRSAEDIAKGKAYSEFERRA